MDFTRNAKIIGKIPSKKKNEKHLNYIESKMLLKELHLNLSKGLGYYLLLLGLTTGLRYAELVGLTHSDFNFTHNTIDINKTWGYSKKMHQEFGPTKNPQSVRTIKVDKVTMSIFKELIKSLPKNENDLIFFSPSSKYKVISNTNANKLLRGILSKMSPFTLSFSFSSMNLVIVFMIRKPARLERT
ncbi:tyrosine-type recombinase/integrase [Ornithinibacillus sp. FSL M8-0202]|uniref:tyrosine-type recombinase/integrase n=1 Tax=Ornithinibacillus sp. FSL M8-0202 TaxID=2921616 RepID=UPI0030D094A8